MKILKFCEYELSQFMLGTVQFGLPYGIANKIGQVPYQTVVKILECAAANGVNCLDTAATYGASEEALGKAMQELGIAGQMVVVTKAPLMDDNLPPAQADYLIEQSVINSLQQLQLDVLPVCLFHVERNAIYAESLLRMKAKGLVKHVGVSVYSPDAALAAIRSGHFEAIQVPASVLDQRFFRNNVFHEARRNGIALFARSVYLQGLLFLPEEKIPPELSDVIDARRRLERIAAEAGLSLADLAVRFVLGLEGIQCVVIGLETIDQLRTNLAVFAQGPLSAELAQTVLDAVPAWPDRILVPGLWPKNTRPAS